MDRILIGDGQNPIIDKLAGEGRLKADVFDQTETDSIESINS
jgi:hypothetical protein